ncbi:glycoside hydrolase family 15 protein [Kineococcus sp. DHX-1]|uniref:glycoside hydrolase family 15 protein n=1 Tax=Kineococcus sp. DHX-1 TaxID=3349638 RepID=UPI0036D24C08
MRRRWLLAAGGASVLGVGTAGATLLPDRTEAAPLPRLLSGPDWYDADPRAESAWLATGRVPGAAGPHGGLVRRALLDLRALTGPDGAVAAGPAPSWAYAWPRDSAFAAAALARTGHLDDADRILRFLARVQLPDGGFEARYRLDGRGTPDDRRRQVDGAGWSLWALRAALDADPDAASARDRAQEHRDLLDRAVEFTLDRTAGGTRLPDPSPDYWELSERSLTLGAVAPLVAGLRAGAAVLSRLRDRRRARTVSGAAGTLAGLVRERFAPAGWTRYGGGRGDGVDAAVTFCLPPFAARADHDVLQALDAYQVLARQPAGGLAPGAGWRRKDALSWTPETALVALAEAACGRTAQADAWLTWFGAHLTDWGSLPEKVLPDGAPAGPAPLGWTAACVVLAVDTLGRG